MYGQDGSQNHRFAHTQQTGTRSRSGGDQSEIQQKLKSIVTQVPQGQINPGPVMNAHNTPKYRSKTQGGQNVRAGYGNYKSKGKTGTGLLGPQPEKAKGMKTLVLDLDETLVHSQFNQIKNPDFIIPVDIEGQICNIFVQKRPGVDNFLKVMSQYYELVIFTASLSKYADPLMNQMDTNGYCTMRLFREHCTYINGVFTKDMSKIGRSARDAMILDNSPSAYMLQPEQAIPIVSWYDDPKDRQLFDLIPLFIQLSQINDCRDAIPRFVKNNVVDFDLGRQVCEILLERQERDKQIQQNLQAQQLAQQQQEQAQFQQIQLLNQKNQAQVKQEREKRDGSHRQKQEDSEDQHRKSQQRPQEAYTQQQQQQLQQQQQRKSKKDSAKNKQEQQLTRDASGIKDENKQSANNDRKMPSQGRIAASTRDQVDDASFDPAQSQLQQQYKTQQAKTQAPQHGKQKSLDVQKPLINPWLQANANQMQQPGQKHLTTKNLKQLHEGDAANVNLRNQNAGGVSPQNSANINMSQVARGQDRVANHKRFQSTGGLNAGQSQKMSAGFIDSHKQKRLTQGLHGKSFMSAENGKSENGSSQIPQIQTDFQYQQQQEHNQGSQLAQSSQPGNGVTNITNIIYNFNLTPSQQLHKKQIELYQQQQAAQAQQNGQGGRPLSQQLKTAGGADGQIQVSGISPTNAHQQRRIAITQGGNRPSSSKKNSTNGINYPVINVSNGNQVQHAQQMSTESPSKAASRGMASQHQMNSLDKSQQMQISQGLSIRDSYKEQAQNIQNQIKRRPQTGGNAQQLNISTAQKGQMGSPINNNYEMQMVQNQEQLKQMQKKQQNQSGSNIPYQVNMRSISGASNKNHLNLNAIKGHSSTPKNQNLANGIGNFRPNATGGLQLVNPSGIPGQRFGNQIKNMTQVINMREHLPVDFRGTNNQGSINHQRLQKKLKLDYMAKHNRYFPGPGAPAGNITTTASQQKSNGPSLFNFGQNSQNLSGFSVGLSASNDRSGASLRRSNKQRSHSSSNNAAINQSNIVFIGNTQNSAGPPQTQQNQNLYSGSGDGANGAMIAMSSKQYPGKIQTHNRNNSDSLNHPHDQRGHRQHDFVKDQKMMVAETAIADQYAAAMLANHGPSGHRNYGASGNDGGEVSSSGVNVMAAMSQSYRNAGGHHSVAIASGSQGNAQKTPLHSGQGNIYEKLRNSYQSPNQYGNNEIMNGTQGVGNSIGAGSFTHQKSPKISGQQGYKQIKVAGLANNAHNFGGPSKSHQVNSYQQQKNVKIMLVGNNHNQQQH